MMVSTIIVEQRVLQVQRTTTSLSVMPGAEAVWSKNTVYEIQRFCGTNSVFPPQRGGNSGFAERPLTNYYRVYISKYSNIYTKLRCDGSAGS
jgi:hypothetical protein